jgi:hypothetical protein
MVDYVKLPANWNRPDPETGDEPEALQPEVEIVWNHYEKGGAKTVAVKVSFGLPRTQE